MSDSSQGIPSDFYTQLAAEEDPYPSIHRLRAEDPVHKTNLGFWFVTRYDDVKSLFNDPRLSHLSCALHEQDILVLSILLDE